MINLREILSFGWKGKTPLLLAAGALAVVAAGVLTSGVTARADGAVGPVVEIPAPAVDEPAGSGVETAIFAGGCFWGIQAVFQHVAGVESAVSGYAGGTVVKPTYEQVGTETTGHAESVKVTFDPSKVSYGKLLQVFFSVAHDPTQLNMQYPDQGPSYRSALFTMSDEQAKVAKAYIAQLDAAKKFPKKIVTEVTHYTNFYQAEDYHQDNGTTLKRNAGYVMTFDLPKIQALKVTFTDLWREKPMLVFASNASS
jgi:peptide-methionine (S)-S-oxide reductase